MAAKKSGLGKGFSDLFLDNATESLGDGGAVTLPIGEIEPDRNQPRRSFDENALSELANSIRDYGVLQPLLVRPISDGSYRIVAGERRWRAAREAGLTQVPVVIKALSDSESAAISLIENLQREDLNAIEEAEGIRRLIEEFGFTQEQAADRLSRSRPAVANALRLLALPEEVRSLVSDGALSAGHARALLGLNEKERIPEAASLVVSKRLSVRETETLVKRLNEPKKNAAKKLGDKVFEETALALSASLQRKVRVSGGKKGGKLEIEFFDREDLMKLIKIFQSE